MNVNKLLGILEPILGSAMAAPEPELRFCCPKCIVRKKSADQSGHLHVNAEVEKFVCFRCGWKGPLSALLKAIGGTVDASIQDWGEVARKLSLFQPDRKIEGGYDNTEPIEYPCAVSHPMAYPDAWNYLTSEKSAGGRGLTMDQINYYQIAAGTERGYATRVFIPTLHDGQVVFWVARTYAGQEPKYMNPKDVSKKHYLFGLEQAKANFDWVIVTEGVFSAIAAGPNAVAAFGKAVSKEQRMMLADAKFKRYYVALDGDARKEANELCMWMKSRDMDVYLVDLRGKEDPDSVDNFRNRLESAKPFDFYATAQYGLNVT